MMKTSGISFYAEYTDRNGSRHYAVHLYNPITGFVQMMRDVKDDAFQYPCCDAGDWLYENERREHQPYAVVSKLNLIENVREYSVWDTRIEKKIAVFYSKSEADEYCDQKNLDFKYE